MLISIEANVFISKKNGYYIKLWIFNMLLCKIKYIFNLEEKDLVWAKLMGHPWWPGLITRLPIDQQVQKQFRVSFYPDFSYSFLPIKKIIKFDQTNKKRYVRQAHKFNHVNLKQFTNSVRMANKLYKQMKQIEKIKQDIFNNKNNEQQKEIIKQDKDKDKDENKQIFNKCNKRKIKSIQFIQSKQQIKYIQKQKYLINNKNNNNKIKNNNQKYNQQKQKNIKRNKQQQQKIHKFIQQQQYNQQISTASNQINHKIIKIISKCKTSKKVKKTKLLLCTIYEQKMAVKVLYRILKNKMKDQDSEIICKKVSLKRIHELGMDISIVSYLKVIKQGYNTSYAEIKQQYQTIIAEQQ